MQVSDVPKTTFNPKVQWWTDANWLDKYDRYLQPDRRSNQDHHRILDRRFTLQSFAASVRHLPGATAECGVHRGTGSALICATLQGSYNGQKHYGFDSFEGLPEGGPNDANWKKGQLAVPLELARKIWRNSLTSANWLRVGFRIRLPWSQANAFVWSISMSI